MSDGKRNVRQQDSLTTAEENRSMFDAIAGYYDGTNKILSFGLDGVWRSHAVNRLQPVPGGSIWMSAVEPVMSLWKLLD